MEPKIKLSIFTKMWRTQNAEELAATAKRLGFSAIEYPLRDGYPVTTADAEKGLPSFAARLRAQGVDMTSIAIHDPATENIFAGCSAAGVPLIRVMYWHNLAGNYMETEAAIQREIEGFQPLCEKYGVKVGVQQHCGASVNTTMELRHLLEPFDPKLVGGVWDAAHSGLAGEEPEQALDIIWDYLAGVNFKSAMYRRSNGPEAPRAAYEAYFTTGAQGQCPWPRAIARLAGRGFTGTICLPAEYTDEHNTEQYAAQDNADIRQLLTAAYGEGCV